MGSRAVRDRGGGFGAAARPGGGPRRARRRRAGGTGRRWGARARRETREDAAPAAASSSSAGGRLPALVRRGMRTLGQDPDEWEARYADMEAESASMGVGVGVLIRDMRRNLPLAARELSPFPGAELSEREREGAERARRDFWPSFWFLQVFVNTVPWTPLVLPLVLRVVPREKVLPRQLIPEEDERVRRLLAWRAAASLRALREAPRDAPPGNE